MTDQDKEVDDHACEARVVEFSRLVEGYAFDFDDMEVIPATATSKAMFRPGADCAPADRLYRLMRRAPQVRHDRGGVLGSRTRGRESARRAQRPT
jgi:hypothetical protein